MPAARPRPHCPKCLKLFQTEAQVAQHLNTKSLPCYDEWIEELANFRTRRVATPTPDSSESQPTSVELPNYAWDNDHSPPDLPTSTSAHAQGSTSAGAYLDPVTDTYQYAGSSFGRSNTSFMQQFDADPFSPFRRDNLWYPFAGTDEWGLGSFLARSGLSKAKTDEFLRLPTIKRLGLSFSTADELRARIEMLPPAPKWLAQRLDPIPNFPTKEPMVVYHRDGGDCAQFLFSNPLFADCMDYTPHRIYKTAERQIRIYKEWMSGDAAWRLQSLYPAGSTIAGIILSSDKTTLSSGTGNRVAHPLMMSLANLEDNVRAKASQHAWLLLALLPCPKFLGSKQDLKKFGGLLEKRVLHRSLDIACHTLKVIAYQGRMFTDPRGYSRWTYTPLVAEIVDLMEALDLACIAPNGSVNTLATWSQFGDSFRHPPRTAENTLGRIAILRERVDRDDLALWLAASKSYGLNGVDEPFWKDWYGTEPSRIFGPEPLHQWMKQFWDHDMHWCRYAVGEAELNFRYSVLQPCVGIRHFKEGVSGLKQVTGREHRELQKYIVPCIADAVSPSFLIAIRARIDFFYLGQCEEPDDGTRTQLEASNTLFHAYKHAIMDAGARRGKSGPISHWNIPKLEIMHSVSVNIAENASAAQWSADTTENNHIKMAKEPFRESNHRDVDPQICRAMDRNEKCLLFDLATSIRTAETTSINILAADMEAHSLRECAEDDCLYDLDSDPADVHATTCATSSSIASTHPHETGSTSRAAPPALETPVWPGLPASGRVARNLFDDALQDNPSHRTFTTTSTAFHLNNLPRFSRITIAEATTMFRLTDLQPALADYVRRRHVAQREPFEISGRRIANMASPLPFSHLDIWTNVLIQTKPVRSKKPTRVHNVQAQPPSVKWPYGYCDTALTITDPSIQWPGRGVDGHTVIQIRSIFRPALRPGATGPQWPYLMYVQRFDWVKPTTTVPIPPALPRSPGGPVPDPISGMYMLKHASRQVNGVSTRLGDVIPLQNIRTPIQLAPRFGPVADPRLTAHNSLDASTSFFLNHYSDKQIYFSVF